MKVVAYNIKPFEKEFLAKANQKKHDITLIANPLGPDTIEYAEGKDAVIVFTNDDVSEWVIKRFAHIGIKYILTRSVDTSHIDKEAAAAYGIKIANIPSYPLQQDIPPDIVQEVANLVIKNLDLWQANKCVGNACQCAETCKIGALKKSKSA
jgi:lactate dehydrogenase-like 2-hydroxyacid dehydrogenase